MCKLRRTERIGIDGEKLVRDAIVQTIDALGYEQKIFSNCIIQYDSVYGKMTTEIDDVVFSPDQLFIFEVKNSNYTHFEYDAETWELCNETESSNPLIQNYNHKLILCELLEIPLESIITIEVLLVNGKIDSRKSPFANDYVLDKAQLSTDLRFLLAPSANQIKFDADQAYRKFCEILKNCNENTISHLRNLERRNAIKDHMKEDRLQMFKHTDIIRCPICRGGLLSFEKCSWELLQKNRRASQQVYLKCNKCGFSRPYDRKSRKELKTIGIIERNNWTEEEIHMITVLDEVIMLRAENQDLAAALKKLEKRNLASDLQLHEAHAEIKRQSDIITDLNNEVEKGKLPSTCFIRLVVFMFQETKRLCVYLTKLVIKIFKSLRK